MSCDDGRDQADHRIIGFPIRHRYGSVGELEANRVSQGQSKPRRSRPGEGLGGIADL